MSRVSDILAAKGGDVFGVAPGATVQEALEQMVEHNVGSLVVMEEEEIIGIFTERDFLRRVALNGMPPASTQVRDVMTERLIVVEPDKSVEECMAIMTQARIRHLPVMDRTRLAGVVSIGDLVKHLSDEQEVHIRYLTDYIVGRYPG
ncbi:MAG TPA: CBS domain-containing protein [Candidatus Limnocylindria bacterium]|nr:CBS domain-containing protein [Candidatus Limnocylindria bacterium]